MSDESEIFFKNKFPEEIICLVCDEQETLKRDEYPNHLMWNHDWETTSWEYIYKRLSAVGVI